MNAPQVGIDLQHDPMILHRPKVIISWDASTETPLAVKKYNEKRYYNRIVYTSFKNKNCCYLLNAFAIATFANTATSGTTMIPEPSSAHTCVNDNV